MDGPMKVDSYCANDALNYSTQLIRMAAEARGIQFELLARYTHHVEHEIYRLTRDETTHLMDITRPDISSAIAFSMTKNKFVTQSYLKRHGLPHTHAVVHSEPKTARKQFHDRKKPCVVKPVVGSDSRGISTNINTEEEWTAAMLKALKRHPICMTEDHIFGEDYRLLMVDHQCIAISQRLPAFVEGNGRDSINELIAAANATRAAGRKGPVTKILVDDELTNYVREQGLGMGSVIEAGRRLYLRKNPSLDLGGVGINRDIILHPSNATQLATLTKLLGLRVAAIDLIANDLTKPFEKDGAAILEVMSRPRIRMQECPFEGVPVKASDAILDMLFMKG